MKNKKLNQLPPALKFPVVILLGIVLILDFGKDYHLKKFQLFPSRAHASSCVHSVISISKDL